GQGLRGGFPVREAQALARPGKLAQTLAIGLLRQARGARQLMHCESARRRQAILLPAARRDEFQQQCWLPERAGTLQVLVRDRCRRGCGGKRTRRRPVPTLEEARDAQLIHDRSEEHTSELQSRGQLVCRLLLETKKSLDYAGDTTMIM